MPKRSVKPKKMEPVDIADGTVERSLTTPIAEFLVNRQLNLVRVAIFQPLDEHSCDNLGFSSHGNVSANQVDSANNNPHIIEVSASKESSESRQTASSSGVNSNSRFIEDGSVPGCSGLQRVAEPSMPSEDEDESEEIEVRINPDVGDDELQDGDDEEANAEESDDRSTGDENVEHERILPTVSLENLDSLPQGNNDGESTEEASTDSEEKNGESSGNSHVKSAVLGNGHNSTNGEGSQKIHEGAVRSRKPPSCKKRSVESAVAHLHGEEISTEESELENRDEEMHTGGTIGDEVQVGEAATEPRPNEEANAEQLLERVANEKEIRAVDVSVDGAQPVAVVVEPERAGEPVREGVQAGEFHGSDGKEEEQIEQVRDEGFHNRGSGRRKNNGGGFAAEEALEGANQKTRNRNRAEAEKLGNASEARAGQIIRGETPCRNDRSLVTGQKQSRDEIAGGGGFRNGKLCQTPRDPQNPVVEAKNDDDYGDDADYDDDDGPGSDGFHTEDESRTTDGSQTADDYLTCDDTASDTESLGTLGEAYFECEDGALVNDESDGRTGREDAAKNVNLREIDDNYDGDSSEACIEDDVSRKVDISEEEASSDNSGLLDETVVEITIFEACSNAMSVIDAEKIPVTAFNETGSSESEMDLVEADNRIGGPPLSASAAPKALGNDRNHSNNLEKEGRQPDVPESAPNGIVTTKEVPESTATSTGTIKYSTGTPHEAEDVSPSRATADGDDSGSQMVANGSELLDGAAASVKPMENVAITSDESAKYLPSAGTAQGGPAGNPAFPNRAAVPANGGGIQTGEAALGNALVGGQPHGGRTSGTKPKNVKEAIADGLPASKLSARDPPEQDTDDETLSDVELFARFLCKSRDPSVKHVMGSLAVERNRNQVLLEKKSRLIRAIGSGSSRDARLFLNLLKEHFLRIKYVVSSEGDSSLPISAEVCRLLWDIPLCEIAKLVQFVDAAAAHFASPIARVKSVAEIIERIEFDVSSSSLRAMFQNNLKKVTSV